MEVEWERRMPEKRRIEATYKIGRQVGRVWTRVARAGVLFACWHGRDWTSGVPDSLGAGIGGLEACLRVHCLTTHTVRAHTAGLGQQREGGRGCEQGEGAFTTCQPPSHHTHHTPRTP